MQKAQLLQERNCVPASEAQARARATAQVLTVRKREEDHEREEEQKGQRQRQRQRQALPSRLSRQVLQAQAGCCKLPQTCKAEADVYCKAL